MSEKESDRESTNDSTINSPRQIPKLIKKIIDVNSNEALLGNDVYQRVPDYEVKNQRVPDYEVKNQRVPDYEVKNQRVPDYEVKNQMTCYQDIIKLLIEDVKKKDVKIKELSNSKGKKNDYNRLSYDLRSQYGVVQNELRETIEKLRSVSSEFSEYKIKSDEREEKLADIERDNTSLKNQNILMNSLMVSQRNQIIQYELLNNFDKIVSNLEIETIPSQIDSSNLKQTNLVLKSKIESLKIDRDLKIFELKYRDDKINDLEKEIVKLKSENTKMNDFIVPLGYRVSKIEGNIELTKYTTLQKSNKELQQKIIELESELEFVSVKLDELASKVTSLTGAEFNSNSAGLNILIDKIYGIFDEYSMIKENKIFLEKEIEKPNDRINNVVTLRPTTNTYQNNNIEFENMTNEETIKRLETDLKNLEKSSIEKEEKLDSKRQKINELKKEIKKLKDKNEKLEALVKLNGQ